MRVPKRVYVVRGLRFESEVGLRRRVLLLAERLTIACATDVVAVSPSVREQMAAVGLLRAKDAVVIGHGSSNGVDAAGIQERVARLDRVTERQRWGLRPDAFVVAYIGRLRRDKGVPELAEAMRSDGLSHAYLLTVGSREGADVEADLATLGERWTPVDWLDDVVPALLACDVVCLPTHREGFPNVVLEAAAAGRPVVTTTATGARGQRDRRSHRSAGTGRGSRGSLANALTALAVDPALRDMLGAQARVLAFDGTSSRRTSGRDSRIRSTARSGHARRNTRP